MLHCHLTLGKPDSCENQMDVGRAVAQPRAATFFPVGPQYFSFMKQDAHINYRQTKLSSPQYCQADSWNGYPHFLGNKNNNKKRCLCPFNLCAHLWSWAKAYVLNNGGVREHMLNYSLQHHSDPKQSKSFHAIPRHKGSWLPLHIRRLCTTS